METQLTPTEMKVFDVEGLGELSPIASAYARARGSSHSLLQTIMYSSFASL